MKGSHPEQLTGAHLFLDMANSGYLFHAVGNVMYIWFHNLQRISNLTLCVCGVCVNHELVQSRINKVPGEYFTKDFLNSNSMKN